MTTSARCQWLFILISYAHTEAAVHKWSTKSVFLKISQKPSIFFKETPAQILSSEFCENFKNTFLKNTYGQILSSM